MPRLAGAMRAVVPAAGTADRDLLARYAGGSEAAFAALVRRHTGLVLGVCRRVLPCVQDAEDATQAVFLVLAKKAGGRWQPSVANWLYSTARQVALKALRANTRRTKREAKADPPASARSTLDTMTGREAFAALDEELDRLPPLYREPLVLCCLQGLTRDEAAERLAVPPATLKSRLDRGRKRLAAALDKRGIASGAALLAALTSTAEACQHRLLKSILATAGGSPSGSVAALAKGVVMNAWAKPMTVGAVLAAVAVGLVGMAPQPSAHADDKPAMKDEKKPDGAKKDAKPEKPGESAESVTVRVVDPDGKPAAGATVYRHQSRTPEGPNAETVAGKTDADGKLVTEWKPFINFHATAEGYCATSCGYLESANAVTMKLAKPLPIKGRLVDLQGKPVPNAKVVVERVSAAENDDLTAAYNAYRVNPDWTGGTTANHLEGQATGAPKGTTTDADGRFELKDVGRMRLVHLRFEAEGIEAARAVVFADPEFANRMKPPTDAEKKMMSGTRGDDRATTHGPEFTHAARPEHIITGTITDAVTGKPVRGAKVVGTSEVIRQFFGNPWQHKIETTTDTDGKFRLAGLVKAKKRYLHVQGTDTAPYLDRIVAVDDVAAYTPVTADVKLTPAVVVRGQLVNRATGKSVAGSVQWLPLTTNERMQKPGSEEAVLYTNQYGHTSPSGIRAAAAADGQFALRVPSRPGVVLARADQFDPSSIFAPTRVRDEDRKLLRKPISDPNVIQLGPKDRESEEFFDTIFFLTPLRWENGYAVVNPDAQAKTVDAKVELDPGTTVTLNATDPDGKLLNGVTVVGPGRYSRNPPTFAKPEIALGGLDPKGQPVQFYLLHKDQKLCAAVIVKGDEKGPVPVRMQACGSVTGRVVDHTGQPVKGAQVMFQMTDTVADELLRQKLFRGSTELSTNADGKFTFPRMFPDVEFGLFVSRPGFRVGTAVAEKMTLKPGETKDVGEFKCRDPKKIDDE